MAQPSRRRDVFVIDDTGGERFGQAVGASASASASSAPSVKASGKSGKWTTRRPSSSGSSREETRNDLSS
jgi:hypothetical protein